MEETYTDSKMVAAADASRYTPELSPLERWKTEDYNLKGCKYPGKFIVFNHHTFEKKLGLSPRNGTEEDAKRVKQTFEKLGFHEADKCQNDLAHDQVINKVTEVTKMSFEEYGSIVIVILTHGELGKLYAKDKDYEVDSLWNILTKSKIASKLAGKPKLFLIQACQGEKADDGVDVIDSRPMENSTIEERKVFRIPLFADFLVAFSSSPGNVSFRHNNGSWFIQCLCDAIDHFKDHMDFESMLTLMKYDIARNKQSFSPKTTDFHDKKQIPIISSTLTKKLYLTETAANMEKKPIQLTLQHPDLMRSKGQNYESEESDVDSRPIRKDQTRKRSTTKNGLNSNQKAINQVASADPISTDVSKFTNVNQMGYAVTVMVTFLATCFIFWMLRSDYNIHCYPPQ